MKKILSLTILTAALAGAAFAQQEGKPHKKTPVNTSKISETKPAEYDNESAFDANGVMRRGGSVAVADKEDAKMVALSDILAKPETFAGKTVIVEGVIVRSCKAEGCWMELAPSKEAKSVRVTFKDHAFFIPLDSAGYGAKAKGVFSVKTLDKAQVEHLIKEDGAHFDNINADGTVTEISFEASGVELTKNSK